MYKIEKYIDHSLTMYKLSDSLNDSWLIICPERGGIITEYHANNGEIFYLDCETLYRKSQNVRGGNPILFPMAGQLRNGTYTWEGKEYHMPNHGLARQAIWKVAETSYNETEAAIVLEFSSDENTLKLYPFEFKVEVTYILKGDKVTIQQRIYNRSNRKMPISPGFHPYFNIEKKKLYLKTDAINFLDYNDNTIQDFSGTLDMSGKVEPVVLLKSTEQSLVAAFNKSKNLVIEKDPAFRYTVLWVQEGKDFVCIEPWTAKKDEWNKQEELLFVNPQDLFELNLTIFLQDNQRKA